MAFPESSQKATNSLQPSSIRLVARASIKSTVRALYSISLMPAPLPTAHGNLSTVTTAYMPGALVLLYPKLPKHIPRRNNSFGQLAMAAWCYFFELHAAHMHS